MSLEGIQWAWEQDVSSPAEQLVLLAIGNVANPLNSYDKGELAFVPAALMKHVAELQYAHPGIEYISRKVKLGERQVRRVLDMLEERDLIVRVERRRGDGRKAVDGYLLITSPDILTAETSPDIRDTTSPDICDRAYREDTQGLDTQGVENSHCSSVKKTPLPPLAELEPVKPLRWTADFTPAQWAAAQRVAVSKTGATLSVKYLANEFEEWVRAKRIVPSNTLNLFIHFINQHKERNNL